LYDGKKRGRSLETNRRTLAQQYLTEFALRLAQRELGQTVDVSLDRLSEEYLSYSKATKKQSTLDRHDKPRVTRFVEFLKGQRLQKPADTTTQDRYPAACRRFASRAGRQILSALALATSGCTSQPKANGRGWCAGAPLRVHPPLAHSGSPFLLPPSKSIALNGGWERACRRQGHLWRGLREGTGLYTPAAKYQAAMAMPGGQDLWVRARSLPHTGSARGQLPYHHARPASQRRSPALRKSCGRKFAVGKR
jgi:hypothetical protein